MGIKIRFNIKTFHLFNGEKCVHTVGVTDALTVRKGDIIRQYCPRLKKCAQRVKVVEVARV